MDKFNPVQPVKRGLTLAHTLTGCAFGGIRLFNMSKEKAIKLPSFPVYLPAEKYELFQKLCKAKRTPMTKVAEQEIDKFINRETRIA